MFPKFGDSKKFNKILEEAYFEINQQLEGKRFRNLIFFSYLES